MRISDLAKQAGLNYHTARKYLMALKERNLDNLPQEQLVEILRGIKKLTAQGFTIHQAIDVLARQTPSDSTTQILLRLEQKIDSLEKENRALRELVQVLMAKIDQLPALEPPKKPWWKRIFKR